MSTACPLPDAAKVRSMLGMLFDGLDVKPGKKYEIKNGSGSWIGVYIGDDGKPIAACACDASLAALSSSALSMIPPAAAQTAAKSQKLTDVMEGNLREIMNICTRLCMSDTSPHIRLEGVHPVAALPAPAVAMIAGAKGRVDFELSVPKYGAGVISVLSV
jgi:hypothetical protein